MFNKRARSSALVVLYGQALSLLPCIGLFAQIACATESHKPAVDGKSADLSSPWKLFEQQNYAQAADGFENLIRTQSPNARLYYYAAVANKQSQRTARAKQLFDYIVKYFPNTAEGKYAQQILSSAGQPAATSAATATPTSELPESVKNALPKEMQDLLATEEGKQAVKLSLMQQSETNLANIRKAEAHGILNKSNQIPVVKVPKPAKRTEHPFTEEDVARLGAHGIDQSQNPNCWFEASMAALAELPRGQRLIASMIRYGDKETDYVVRFPRDGVEYKISAHDLEESGMHDKAQWASILECAQIRKFPDNAGAQGEYNDQSRLEVGLGCITGCTAEVVLPKSCSVQELSTFIDGAVRSRNPIVAATYPDSMLGTLPDLVVGQHAFTVVGFDPAKALITIRNPHGQHAQRFSLGSDPQHREFEQLDDGVFKISLPLFQKYFHSVARSFI